MYSQRAFGALREAEALVKTMDGVHWHLAYLFVKALVYALLSIDASVGSMARNT